jgi:hypothetical protein
MADLGDEHWYRLKALEQTVAEAADFLSQADQDLWDGHQTAREVLSHLVFWHREYLKVAQAMAEGSEFCLQQATFAELNAAAVQEFQAESMQRLAQRLLSFQRALSAILSRLPDWEMDFPVKHGGRRKAVAERVENIEAHIGNHLRKLQRAQRLGQDWVRAYYEEPH